MLTENKDMLLRKPAVRILFHEGFGVGYVVLGIVRLAWTGGFDILGRYAAPYFAGTYLGILEYQGTSCHDGAFANLTAVE